VDAQHVPVLLEETLGFLAPERRPGGLFVDATVGLGGHAEALLQRAPEARVLGLDRDPQALELAARRLAPFEDRVLLVHAVFDQLEEVLAGLGIDRVAGVLADLGVSSMQLDVPERGFSFRHDGPLDMRMGIADLTAADLVNRSSEEELARIFREYGEERHARRIARAIARARAETPITTTGQLKSLIDRIRRWSSHQEKIDPATRVFQALRIEVNQELDRLAALIDQTVRLLEPDGRLVIISYHSLEDRIVKNRMRELAHGEVDPVTGRTRSETQLIEALTRKPVRPSDEEIAFNPRSRSAKLRAAKRV
jgi:16S rRNA (cytosine1402-N4)-methyltransferase